MLYAGPGRIVFTTPDLTSPHPNRGLQNWGSDLSLLCSRSNHVGATWRAVIVKRSSSPGLARRNTSPPIGGASEQDPEQVDPGLGTSVPPGPTRFRVKVQGPKPQFSRTRRAGVALAWPGKQDCLQGERKTTCCLWVSGKGQSQGQGGSYSPRVTPLHTSTGYRVRAFGITCFWA